MKLGVGRNAAGWTREFSTGLLVTASAIPLAIGLAGVAGVPPVVGLYTCVWPLVVFAVLGSSRHLKLGMDASSAALIAATVPPLVIGQPGRYVAVASALTLLAGLVVLIAGVVRLGIVAELLSLPVLVGYTAGIGISVIIGQVVTLLGVEVERDGNDLQTAAALVGALGDAHAWTVAAAVVALVAIWLLRTIRPTWPASVVVLIAGIAMSALLDLGARGVATVGGIPSGLPTPSLPDVTGAQLLDLAGPAMGIALVIAADSVITSRSFAVRLKYQVRADRDMIGLGAANVASSLTGGVVASASYARTAISERNGSRNQWSSVFAAVLMIAVLALLTGTLTETPVALLAAIVIDAVARLVDPRPFAQLFAVRPAEALLAVGTTVAVLLLGLLPAIVLAIGFALGLALVDLVGAWRAGRELAGHPRLGRLVDRPPSGAGKELAWQGPLVFTNTGRFRRSVVDAIGADATGQVRLDARDVTMVDATAAQALAELQDALLGRGTALEIDGMDPEWLRRVRVSTSTAGVAGSSAR